MLEKLFAPITRLRERRAVTKMLAAVDGDIRQLDGQQLLRLQESESEPHRSDAASELDRRRQSLERRKLERQRSAEGSALTPGTLCSVCGNRPADLLSVTLKRGESTPVCQNCYDHLTPQG